MPLARAAGAAWPLLNCARCTNGCWAVTECGWRGCGRCGWCGQRERRQERVRLGGQWGGGIVHCAQIDCGSESDNSGGGGRQVNCPRSGITNHYTDIRKTYGEWGRSHCHIIKNYRGITKSYTSYNSRKMPMPPPLSRVSRFWSAVGILHCCPISIRPFSPLFPTSPTASPIARVRGQ